MKEALNGLFLLLSLCLLTSCNANDTNPVPSIPEQDQTPTIHEIIESTETQLQDTDTFTMQLNMSQTVSEGEFNQETVHSNTLTYYNVSPLAHHQIIETQSTTSKSSEIINIEGEQYVTEEGAYMLNASSDEWMEVPLELIEDVISFQNVQLEPIRYLEILKEHDDQISMEEEDTHYKLEVDGEGTETRELVMQLYNISNLADEQQSLGLVNQMNIEAIDYELMINKETFLLDQVLCKIELLQMYEGNQIKINLQLETEMTDYNQTHSIEIPAEIIENAQEYKINLTNTDETNN